MKWAKVTLLQDELMSADTADYHDYQGLLRCPNPSCNQVVFLRKKHTRKGIEIGASFVHHKQDNTNPIACENRVNGYTQKDIERINARAKGQRLDLLNKWMSVFIKDAVCVQHTYSRLGQMTDRGKYQYKEISVFLEQIIKHYKNRRWLLECAEKTIEIYKTKDTSVLHLIDYHFDDNVNMAQDLGFLDDRNIDLGKEVICFLMSEQGRKAFKDCIPYLAAFILDYYVQIIHYRKKEFDEDEIGVVENAYLQGLVLLFTCNIRWAEVYEKAKRGEYIQWKIG